MYRTLLILAPLTLAAAEPSAPAAELSPVLVFITGTLLPLIIAAVWYFMRWGKRVVEPMPEGLSLDATRNFFIDKRLIPFATNVAEHWLLTELPEIVSNSALEGFKWRDIYVKLQEYVKERALHKFAAENRDVIAYLGSSAELNDIIDRTVLRAVGVLPDRVQGLIPGGVVEALANSIADGAQQLLLARVGK